MKMLKSNRKIQLAIGIFATLFLTTQVSQAQVKIGEDTAPVKGAVLDLSNSSSGYVGGLKLPNVSITSLTAIPTTFKEFSSGTPTTAEKTALTGAVVYNTNTTTGVGVYYWDGTQWVKQSTLTTDANTTYNISAGAGAGAVTLTPSFGTAQNITVNVNDADYIVGNEVTDATNATLVRNGSGTAASPYTLARAAITGDVSIATGSNAATVTALQGKSVATTAPTSGQVLQWNGTAWTPTANPGTTAWFQGGNTNGTLKTLGTNDCYDLPFVTCNSERMRLTTIGYLGIGTTVPSQKLHVIGTSYVTDNHIVGQRVGINLPNYAIPSSAIQIVSETNENTDDITINSYKGSYTGSAYVPTLNLMSARGTSASPSNSGNGDVIGSIIFWPRLSGTFDFQTARIDATYTGTGSTRAASVSITGTQIGGSVAWTNFSDVRLKTNIVPLKYGLSDIMKLNPVNYEMKNNPGVSHVGFIAQDVKPIIPELVAGQEGDLDKKEVLSISYAEFAPILTRAIQEQQKMIEDQQKIIEQLEARLKILETK